MRYMRWNENGRMGNVRSVTMAFPEVFSTSRPEPLNLQNLIHAEAWIKQVIEVVGWSGRLQHTWRGEESRRQRVQESNTETETEGFTRIDRRWRRWGRDHRMWLRHRRDRHMSASLSEKRVKVQLDVGRKALP
ncbi:hypothetical protein J6590_035305 [Homalodisca vitripennis]|nr:hypothetical protein J6590_035305 [Homalodisca vitripennis]